MTAPSSPGTHARVIGRTMRISLVVMTVQELHGAAGHGLPCHRHALGGEQCAGLPLDDDPETADLAEDRLCQRRARDCPIKGVTDLA